MIKKKNPDFVDPSFSFVNEESKTVHDRTKTEVSMIDSSEELEFLEINEECKSETFKND